MLQTKTNSTEKIMYKVNNAWHPENTETGSLRNVMGVSSVCVLRGDTRASR